MSHLDLLCLQRYRVWSAWLKGLITCMYLCRCNQITDNVTHVVLGDKINSDMEQIKSLSIRYHVCVYLRIVSSTMFACFVISFQASDKTYCPHMFSYFSTKTILSTYFFLFLHKNMLWVLIRSAWVHFKWIPTTCILWRNKKNINAFRLKKVSYLELCKSNVVDARCICLYLSLHIYYTAIEVTIIIAS